MKDDNTALLCLSLSPIDLAHPGIAIATSRAGGVGFLDTEHATDTERGLANLDLLLAATDAPVGLRLAAPLGDAHATLLARLEQRAHWLILSAADTTDLSAMLASLPSSGHRRVLAELRDAGDLQSVCSLPIDGLVAKGNEAGGWVGEDTTFILAQKVFARLAEEASPLPVYLHGGIGVYNAAACKIVGAAGVVLDDQLLLMPESPLPAHWTAQLEKLTGQETRVLGELRGDSCRVLQRPGFAGFARLQEVDGGAEDERRGPAVWHEQAQLLIGWGDPGTLAWPIGQAVGFAARFRDRYQTTGRLIQALVAQSEAQVKLAAQIKPLAAGSALAKSHGTRYPLVQGPMTRVSDRAAFAAAVARGGALPFLALALMRGEQVLELLQETREQVGEDLPWGIGLLGFVPHALRQEQLEAVWKVKPPFALIAGGRPDQALEFERRGVPAYIHVPAPELLRLFLDQGARRFVFEGRECGGHIGPLSSFMLWESMVQVLLDKVPAATMPEVHLLFAGGVHDATSAAMLSALVAPLAERGARIGALMGSAYLFTEEVVSSGAVVEGFQAQALACTTTANLETGPGHATRCAVTPFAHEFHTEHRRLLATGAGADEIRDSLEDLNLGRLRIASKGLQRAADGGEIEHVSADAQLAGGMYMIGQVATLRDRVTSIDALHEEVCDSAGERLDEAVREDAPQDSADAPSDIAIVGIGTLLPGNQSPQAYWDTVLNKRDCIQEVPRERWDWRLYFDEDRRKRDHIYSRWGGFIQEVPFDPLRFGIPPKSLKSIDPMQLLALEVVRRGLEDAGYPDGDFDRENTSVIFGAGGGLGDLGLQYGVRAELPRFVASPDDEAWDRLPEWTEESFAGSLLNVVAGRVANRFDFGGLNFTVDAACASSLAALNLAVQELESGRSNVAIAGGVDTVQSPFGYLCFSKTQALSPGGRAKTFDHDGDGIVISEGLAVVVLKRLADAERDGDRIYALVKSVGGSSDGKALGLTAPLPEGQMRALNRAYRKAGFSPSTVELIEAHGTGTPVGDRAETETVVRTLNASGTRAKSCAVGSVKTLIGHTKATAGLAGLAKVALALHHRVLPAHHGVSKPIAPIADPGSPIYLLKEARPWLANPDYPRRGSVSSFGFGGTNFHAVLEGYEREYRPGATRLGAEAWPAELMLFHGKGRDALTVQAQALLTALGEGARPAPKDLAFSLIQRFSTAQPGEHVLGIVAADLGELAKTLDAVIPQLATAKPGPLAPGVHFGELTAGDAPPVALLFPGQGSQYPNMLREPSLYIAQLREALETADARLQAMLPRRLSQYVFPPGPFDDEEEAANRQALTDTKVAQPAIGAIEMGLAALLARLGLEPAMSAGHSYGEYAALFAAGALSRDSFLSLSATRGAVMAEACDSSAGTMAAISAERSTVEAVLEDIAGAVVANHNTPQQTVISGSREGVEAAVKALSERDIRCTPLPVAGAFHTELMASAQERLTAAIAECPFEAARFAVYSNTTGDAYPDNADAIRELLSGHLLRPVEFVQQVQNMYEAGARVFVEVGPKSTLTGMVGRTLSAQPHLAVSLDPQSGSMRGLLATLASLTCAGVHLELARLFDGRGARSLDLDRLSTTTLAPKLDSARTWHISGGGARAPKETVMQTGVLPALTLEAAQAARAEAAPRSQATPRPVAEAPVTAEPIPPIASVPVAEATEPAPMPAPAITTATAPALTEDGSRAAFLAYQETMRQFLHLQEQVMTQLLPGTPAAGTGAVTADSVAASPVAPQVEASAATAPTLPAALARPPAATAAPIAAEPQRAVAPIAIAATVTTPAMDSAALMTLLLELVSERTGYPADMLGTDQDMEAELGIDSIKRVEILGALQERLPAAMADGVREAMETLTRAKSLNAVVQVLDGLAGHAANASASASASAAAPAGAPAPVAAPAMDSAALMTLLLELVSERTGYPADMLGADQDMEAELGIDSIKRVEILGALQERLPAAMADGVREAMETLTRAKSLNAVVQVLDGLAGHAANASASAPASASAAAPAGAPAPVATPAMDSAALMTLLLELVSERTGYPADMLGTDQDMEAELGIDSIKRVEILGALQERLPAAMADGVREAMETLTRAKSLNAVVQVLDGLAGHAANASASASAAAPAGAPAPVAAPAMDSAALMTLLLELVSERTGYPADMLGADQDMEAELGIDSIKRVEILGALQERLPAAMADGVREAMETLTRAKSLNAVVQVLDGLAGHAANASASAPASASAAAPAGAPAPVAAPAMGSAALMTLLLELVSERTGYPADMLGADQDMEAELGIDSIKRVEILGALQERLPAAMADGVREAMETLTRAKSLNAVVQVLDGLAGPAPTVASSATVEEPPLPRYVMRAMPQTLDGVGRRAVHGQVILSDDGGGVATALAGLLSEQGAQVTILSRATLADATALATALETTAAPGSRIVAVVHLAPLTPMPWPGDLEAWRAASRIDIKALFQMLHTCGAALRDNASDDGAVVVSASALGGHFGRNHVAAASLPSSGAAIGLLKTLSAEWPGVRSRAIDTDPSMPPAQVAMAIFDEMTTLTDTVEIGYPQGERHVFHTTDAPLDCAGESAIEPASDWVVLITAGARGITHQIARELARPGMRFVIAGRTPEPVAEESAFSGIDGTSELRKALIALARGRGEQPTPAMVDSTLSEILRSREIRDNLAYLRDAGVDVEYAAIDVRSESDFGGLITNIYSRHGRLDAVLHGAGIIEDKLVADKTEESFARVFDTKADSTFVLARHLKPDNLSLVVFFTSVAGRYGNIGQCDYGAANESVNRFAWALDQAWPATRVMAINWGPWDAPGMASDTVKRRFKERGIVPVAVHEGRRFFDQELRHGLKGEAEVVAGVGPWKDLDAHAPSRQASAGQTNETATGGESRALIRGTPEFAPGGDVTFSHEFSVLSDPYLRDHCLDGKPVLPATAAAEWLAQFVQVAWPDWVVSEVHDLRVLKGFVLGDGAGKSALLKARASSHADASSVKITAEILEPTSGVAFYRASVLLRSTLESAPMARDEVPAIADEGGAVDPATAYRDYLFHGERFQLIRSIERLNDQGADAHVAPADLHAWLGLGAGKGSAWLFDPGLLDTAPQLAIIWSRMLHNSTPLPSRLGRVVRYGGEPLLGPLTLSLRVKASSATHQLIYDAFFIDDSGRIRVAMFDVEGTSSSALNRLAAGI